MSGYLTIVVAFALATVLPDRVKTPRSPRVSATSEPERKPVVTDAFPDIPTLMSEDGGIPVVL